jgi:hypothetical protein
VRVNLVVVGDPRRQLTYHRIGIGSRTDADVVAFDRADEGFSHSVALRTFDGRRSWFKTDLASEAARIARNVAAAVVGQPFDGDRQAVDPGRLGLFLHCFDKNKESCGQ